MSQSNALYFLRQAIRTVADELSDGNEGLYGLEYDPERGSVDFALEGESRYRIELTVFEMKGDDE